MVIGDAVNVEKALIDARGHDGESVDIQNFDDIVRVLFRFPDGNLEGLALRLFADTEHIAAEVDDGALTALLDQKILQAVGNVSLCRGARVNLRDIIAEVDHISLDVHTPIVDFCECRLNLCLGRQLGLAARKVPERTQRKHCHIKGAVRELTVAESELNHIEHCGARLPGCDPAAAVVHAVQLAVGLRRRKHFLVVLEQLKGLIEHSLVLLVVERDRNHGVKEKAAALQRLSVRSLCLQAPKNSE